MQVTGYGLLQHLRGVGFGLQLLAEAQAGLAGPEDVAEDVAAAVALHAHRAAADVLHLGRVLGLLVALLAVVVAVLALLAADQLVVAAAAAGVAGDQVFVAQRAAAQRRVARVRDLPLALALRAVP